MEIGLKTLQDLNVQRGNRWHEKSINDWTPMEWAAAMAGEAGEACNAAKKLRRLEGNIQNHDERDANPDVDKYRKMIARESADTVIYAVLLCARVGMSLEDAVREVFNEKSIEYGFPERL